jgi:hypothetical protein
VADCKEPIVESREIIILQQEDTSTGGEAITGEVQMITIVQVFYGEKVS